MEFPGADVGAEAQFTAKGLKQAKGQIKNISSGKNPENDPNSNYKHKT